MCSVSPDAAFGSLAMLVLLFIVMTAQTVIICVIVILVVYYKFFKKDTAGQTEMSDANASEAEESEYDTDS